MTTYAALLSKKLYLKNLDWQIKRWLPCGQGRLGTAAGQFSVEWSGVETRLGRLSFVIETRREFTCGWGSGRDPH